MEKGQEWVVLLEDLVQDARIFFSEHAVLEFGIGDSLSSPMVFLRSTLYSIETFWVLDHDIEPEVGLDLLNYMRVCACRNALNRRFWLWERLEKADDAFTDSRLFSLFVDINRARIKEVDLAVSEVFLCRLSWSLWKQSGIDYEHGSDLYLGQQITLDWHF